MTNLDCFIKGYEEAASCTDVAKIIGDMGAVEIKQVLIGNTEDRALQGFISFFVKDPTEVAGFLKKYNKLRHKKFVGEVATIAAKSTRAPTRRHPASGR